MKARIAGVVKDSIVDGPGLRHAVFFQGCPHRCNGCHNEHTWPFVGVEEKDVRDILRAIDEDKLCRGVTLTGGEPLMQEEAASDIACHCHMRGLSVWLYTGFRFEDVCDMPVFAWVDVCVDGPFIEELKDYRLKWRGSSNQRVIDVSGWRMTGEICEIC